MNKKRLWHQQKQALENQQQSERAQKISQQLQSLPDYQERLARIVQSIENYGFDPVAFEQEKAEDKTIKKSKQGSKTDTWVKEQIYEQFEWIKRLNGQALKELKHYFGYQQQANNQVSAKANRDLLDALLPDETSLRQLKAQVTKEKLSALEKIKIDPLRVAQQIQGFNQLQKQMLFHQIKQYVDISSKGVFKAEEQKTRRQLQDQAIALLNQHDKKHQHDLIGHKIYSKLSDKCKLDMQALPQHIQQEAYRKLNEWKNSPLPFSKSNQHQIIEQMSNSEHVVKIPLAGNDFRLIGFHMKINNEDFFLWEGAGSHAKYDQMADAARKLETKHEKLMDKFVHAFHLTNNKISSQTPKPINEPYLLQLNECKERLGARHFEQSNTNASTQLSAKTNALKKGTI